jgi:hypothetical protein
LRCHRYDRLIVLYLHDELADEARRELERHLDLCVTCRERFEAFRAVIERAGDRDVPAPTARTIESIRQAAEVGVTDSGRRAAGALWGNRWYGARVGIAAAVSCIVLLAAVAFKIVGRPSSPPPYEPPVQIAERPVPPRTDEDLPLRAVVFPEERDGLVEPVRAPSDLEARLASLEADTFYIDQEIAREMMPVFDRRVYGLENAVFTLALDLERE